MTVYIGSKRKLAIRWKAKNPNHTSSWNLIQYVSTNKSKDTVISVGKAVLISDDKDCLSAMRIHMIKNLMASADRRVAGPKAQCQLHTDGEAGKFTSEKRPYEDIEQELAETDVKIVKLEQDNRKLKQNVLAI
ncbi:Uncharacterized protein APZ42_006873 [Daphnia magna]|uniref:Uncharacterized protein n=1 Tax=Daphnia magna TaxID=35525 RepID=A0A164FNB6_9CRUS|nr:Uncharacterized protein APZ42_006873 [Daphnia magna]